MLVPYIYFVCIMLMNFHNTEYRNLFRRNIIVTFVNISNPLIPFEIEIFSQMKCCFQYA